MERGISLKLNIQQYNDRVTLPTCLRVLLHGLGGVSLSRFSHILPTSPLARPGDSSFPAWTLSAPKVDVMHGTTRRVT